MAKFVFVLAAILASTIAVYSQTCGKPSVPQRPLRVYNPNGQRIVGGTEARPNSYPWIVSMQQSGSHFCGGSLVRIGNLEKTDIVITAAHCVYDGFSGVTVSAGAHSFDSPTSDVQTVRGASAVYHEQYNPDTTENDIAIVKLAKPISFTKNIQPVCLPASGESVTAGTVATVAGWGLTKENGYSTSKILMQVGVPIIDGKSCAKQYQSQGVAIDNDVMICAGFAAGGKDSCQGDSGGPFVLKQKDGSFVLQGVVSFGIGCARPGLPGVYARVSSFVDWIQGKIQENSSLV